MKTRLAYAVAMAVANLSLFRKQGRASRGARTQNIALFHELGNVLAQLARISLE
jgi:hypothetical protein